MQMPMFVRTSAHVRSRSTGFTILEMLVVLIIVGFVSSILFEALGQIYKLQSRFGLQLAQSQQGAMYTDWFRQVVQGLQTDFENGKEKFQGSESEFTGVSTSPLSADYGVPTTVTLTLQYNSIEEATELLYGANEKKTKLSSWAGRKTARFIYVDAKGDQHDTWPPPFDIWPQLPNMILLQTEKDSEPQLVAAVPRGSLEPRAATAEMTGTPF
jgi:general secretion pathway protein J